MDKIYINDLEVYGYHGVYDAEKKLGQRFLISVEIETDLRTAATHDDLDATINYGALCHELEHVFLEEKINLIESITLKLADYILLNYEVAKAVRVKIKKPWAPIGKPVDYVAVEMERKWHKAYIAFGSNMGNREENINEAKRLIEESQITKIIKTSTLIETEPWGYTNQDHFLNGVWEVETLLQPGELMTFLLEIEHKLKRERVIKWGPRTLDLDILLYDEMVSNDSHIIIPHPRMHQRLFVLEPLNEIAPYALHPLLNKRVFELKEELESMQ
ncbi:2-amino-4-hydroxy-6-hydroxymethyldihydropteridine diphosphokinase [Vallitalea okinawensis]|uniref:2-amino-4-hydroxy-6- hydroxymethyldihydropteridine diphosphokinase n=1 Tax=Vallitalea okinawensis TaxID=2078660 RepID=UPI000CFCBA97|nr:2-amino-4-hydroxy-6-hydroxymethyldihydropteridine diphosphokinase [Vallitalea okinawensis]